MNKQIFSLLFTAALMVSCASTNANASGLRDVGGNTSDPGHSTLEGHEWKLIDVYIDGVNTGFNRNTLPEEIKNFFTVNFDAQIVSGVGAPNRYTAPYTLSDNQTISIMVMRSTLMATFLEPENLSEHDFFTYMQNSYSWKLVNNNLELLSKTRDGGEVRLVFSL
jgi:heat shock protein HslJ